ncbi:MAG: DUF58 domain-containing protein [Flavobacteriales bacterium]|nr:DUF58 domain-containing protein [Flavobacteriales bacterium]MCX7768492.1 DUF58 domain-containing protein [Flavobacteriales bacterium]MDW8409825.1 DUF58 domain-containing protein [Flavobacteriales bacterium]
METTELLRRVRRIEIVARGLSSQFLSGSYHSAFKGRGVVFSEVRPYVIGDDVRRIDWNVTARLQEPFVKVFEEERELLVMLLLDMSGSLDFGTRGRTKRHLMAEMAAVLALSAIANNDKVGAIFFTDKVEAFIPPRKGRSHMLRIVRDVLEFQPAGKSSDVSCVLPFLRNTLKKRATAFLFSDFITPSFEKPLRVAAAFHDIVALHLVDPREENLPTSGLFYLLDNETGEGRWIDFGDRATRRSFQEESRRLRTEVQNLFQRQGIDYAVVYTDKPYIKELVRIFERRSGR